MINYKLLTSAVPSIYLILLPYKYRESLFILIIYSIFIKKRKILYFKILKSIKSISKFYIYLILCFILFDHPNNKVITKSLIFPYFLSITFSKKETSLYVLNFHYIVFQVSSYLVKGIMINAIHLIITSNLFLFTKNELLLSGINLLKQKINNNKKKINNSNQLSLNILGSYEMFEVILKKFYHMHIGIKCKNNISLICFMNYLIYFFNNVLGRVTREIHLSIVNLWIRY